MQFGDNQSSAGDLSLHELAANNDVKNLTSKLSSPGQDVNKRDNFGRTPLHKVAIHNQGQSHFEVAEILLNNGADPNALDSSNCTLFRDLVRNGSVEILKLFLRFKADFTDVNEFGSSLLLPAISFNNLDVLKFLLQDIGLDRDKYNLFTPLNHAAHWNVNDSHYEIIKYLLEMGFEVNVQDSEGKTPIYYAIRYGNLRVFDLFLKYKADLEVVENILFEFADYNSDIKVLEKLFLLLNLGLNVNQKDTRGCTPLHYAVKGNHYSRVEPINVKIVKCFLRNGANINVMNSYGFTPLVNALPRITRFFSKDKQKESYFADFLFEQTDFSVPNERFYMDEYLGKFILKHLAKLKFLKIPVHPMYQKFIKDRSNKNYFDKCIKELELMSSTRPQNSWITFINLLVDDRRRLKNYAGNEDFMNDYQNNDWLEMFPIYGDLFKRNVDKGIRKRELYDKSSILFSNCLPIFNPNHLIVKDILDCVLSKKDLSKFLCQ